MLRSPTSKNINTVANMIPTEPSSINTSDVSMLQNNLALLNNELKNLKEENHVLKALLDEQKAPPAKLNVTKNASSNEFTLVQNKRKRDSPTKKPLSKQQKVSDWLSAPTSSQNKYVLLEEEILSDEKNTKEKIQKPPPIFVAGVQNITPLTELLEVLAPEKHDIKLLNPEEIKIQAKDPDTYRLIVNALSEKQQEFHTYKMKADRSYRTVLRGLHPSTSIEVIKNEIEKYGHSVCNIYNLQNRMTKKPLPLFFIDINPQANNKEIFNITKLFHTIVSFEPPHKKREIPQCISCQRYGHTSKYCNRKPRCVKCAGDHHTKDCQRKTKDGAVKCVLCQENHPANYKGCAHYKTLQKKAFPSLRFKDLGNDATDSNKTNVNQYQTTQPNITYADVINNATQPSSNNQQKSTCQLSTPGNHHSSDIIELKEMMKNLMSQMGTMIQLLTSIVTNKNYVSTI